MDVGESSKMSDIDHYDELQIIDVESQSDPTVRLFSSFI